MQTTSTGHQPSSKQPVRRLLAGRCRAQLQGYEWVSQTARLWRSSLLLPLAQGHLVPPVMQKSQPFGVEQGKWGSAWRCRCPSPGADPGGLDLDPLHPAALQQSVQETCG